MRINFTSIFKVFTKLPFGREATRAIWKTLKIQVKLILNCPRALAITCLSHEGQNFVQRTLTFKVMPSRKPVCRLSLKNRLAVAREKPAKILRKTQQVQFIQSNFFTSAYEVKNNLCLFESPFKIQKNGVFLFEIERFSNDFQTFS